MFTPHWDPTLTVEVKAIADGLLPIFYADVKRVAHRERTTSIQVSFHSFSVTPTLVYFGKRLASSITA
jgi:hypothetical protein